MQATNASFTLILLAGVFLLGRALAGTTAGLWSALLVVLNPALVASTWYLSLDYPLAAMVAVGLWLVIKTAGFTRRWWCLALVLWSVAGMYVKPTYCLYLLAPSVVALAGAVARREPRLGALFNAVVSLLVAANLYLAIQHSAPLAMLREFTWHAGTNDGLMTYNGAGSLAWFLAIPRLAADSFPLPLLVLALAGVALLHIRRTAASRWIVLSALWGWYVLFTLLSNKLDRYNLPVYPLLCVVTAAWLCKIQVARRRRLALAGAAAAYAVLLCVTHHHPPPYLTSKHLGYELIMPTHDQLQRLRDHTFSAACDLRPLVRLTERWASKTAGVDAVSLVHLDPEINTPRIEEMSFVFHELFLGVMHRLPHKRLQIGHLMVTPVLGDGTRQASAAVVIHPPAVRLDRLHHDLVVLRYQELDLQCQAGTQRLAVSLIRPAMAARR